MPVRKLTDFDLLPGSYDPSDNASTALGVGIYMSPDGEYIVGWRNDYLRPVETPSLRLTICRVSTGEIGLSQTPHFPFPTGAGGTPGQFGNPGEIYVAPWGSGSKLLFIMGIDRKARILDCSTGGWADGPDLGETPQNSTGRRWFVTGTPEFALASRPRYGESVPFVSQCIVPGGAISLLTGDAEGISHIQKDRIYGNGYIWPAFMENDLILGIRIDSDTEDYSGNQPFVIVKVKPNGLVSRVATITKGVLGVPALENGSLYSYKPDKLLYVGATARFGGTPVAAFVSSTGVEPIAVAQGGYAPVGSPADGYLLGSSSGGWGFSSDDGATWTPDPNFLDLVNGGVGVPPDRAVGGRMDWTITGASGDRMTYKATGRNVFKPEQATDVREWWPGEIVPDVPLLVSGVSLGGVSLGLVPRRPGGPRG